MQVFMIASMLTAAGLVAVRMSRDATRSVKNLSGKQILEEVHDQIVETLNDPYNCEATLRGKSVPLVTTSNYKTVGASVTSVLGAQVKMVTGTNIPIRTPDNPAGVLTYLSKPVITYVGNRCASDTHDVAGTQACVYAAKTDSRLQVAGMWLGKLSVTKTDGSTRIAPTLFVEYRKGVAANKTWDSLTVAQRRQKVLNSQYGSVTIRKQIELAVTYNAAGTAIQNCSAVEAIYLQEFCEGALSGVWDTATNTCKSIKIQSTDGTQKAITAADPASDPGNVSVEVTANAKATGNANVGGKAETSGTLNVTGATTFDGGSAATGLIVAGNTTMEMNATTTGTHTSDSFATGVASIAKAANTRYLCINGVCVGQAWNKLRSNTSYTRQCSSNLFQYGTASDASILCKSFPSGVCSSPNSYVLKVDSTGASTCGIVDNREGFACSSNQAAHYVNLATGAASCYSLGYTACAWAYGAYVGLTSYSSTARGTSSVVPGTKLINGLNITTTNSSPTNSNYSSGAIRLGVYSCTPGLQ